MMAGRLSAPAARAHTNSLAGRLRIGVENSVTGEEIARYFRPPASARALSDRTGGGGPHIAENARCAGGRALFGVR